MAAVMSAWIIELMPGPAIDGLGIARPHLPLCGLIESLGLLCEEGSVLSDSLIGPYPLCLPSWSLADTTRPPQS